MSKAWRVKIAVTLAAAALLWFRAASLNGSLLRVFGYSIAGVISGVGLTYIAREFASLRFNGRLALESAVFGFLIFTPLIAMLIGNSTDATSSSVVVIATTAAAAAALLGAVWGVAGLADEAFSEWRQERRTPRPPQHFEGALP